jgi:Tol biopolymer transport system component
VSSSSFVDADRSSAYDVYVHGRRTGETDLASVRPGGHRSIGASGAPSISADGRFIAFDGSSPERRSDILVRDRETGETTRVSVGAGGEDPTSGSILPAITADGRFVAFSSYATNLVPGDTNGSYDAFVHDRATGETARVSVSNGGDQVNHPATRLRSRRTVASSPSCLPPGAWSTAI